MDEQLKHKFHKIKKRGLKCSIYKTLKHKLTLDDFSGHHVLMIAFGMEERFHLYTILQILGNLIPSNVIFLGIYLKNCLVCIEHPEELV